MRMKILIALGVICCLIGCAKELKMEVVEKHPTGAKKKEIYYYTRVSDPRRIILYGLDGKVKSDRFMKNGKPDSLFIIYHPNGKKLKETKYIQDAKTKQEMKHGKECTWYESGQLNSEATYENGAPKGFAVTYYEDGTKAAEIPFKDGNKEGEEIHYFPDGKKKMLITYKNSDRNGALKEWYLNGNLKKEETYLKNVLDGPMTLYYEDGKKETACHYKNGRIHGLKQQWQENGRLCAKATYENGKFIEGTSY